MHEKILSQLNLGLWTTLISFDVLYLYLSAGQKCSSLWRRWNLLTAPVAWPHCSRCQELSSPLPQVYFYKPHVSVKKKKVKLPPSRKTKTTRTPDSPALSLSPWLSAVQPFYACASHAPNILRVVSCRWRKRAALLMNVADVRVTPSTVCCWRKGDAPLINIWCWRTDSDECCRRTGAGLLMNGPLRAAASISTINTDFNQKCLMSLIYRVSTDLLLLNVRFFFPKTWPHTKWNTMIYEVLKGLNLLKNVKDVRLVSKNNLQSSGIPSTAQFAFVRALKTFDSLFPSFFCIADCKNWS